MNWRMLWRLPRFKPVTPAEVVEMKPDATPEQKRSRYAPCCSICGCHPKILCKKCQANECRYCKKGAKP